MPVTTVERVAVTASTRPGHGEQDPPFRTWAIQERSSLRSPRPHPGEADRREPAEGRGGRRGREGLSAGGHRCPSRVCVRSTDERPRPRAVSAALPRPAPGPTRGPGLGAHVPPARHPGSPRPLHETAPRPSPQGCPFGPAWPRDGGTRRGSHRERGRCGGWEWTRFYQRRVDPQHRGPGLLTQTRGSADLPGPALSLEPVEGPGPPPRWLPAHPPGASEQRRSVEGASGLGGAGTESRAPEPPPRGRAASVIPSTALIGEVNRT